jgi:hypothetical protein
VADEELLDGAVVDVVVVAALPVSPVVPVDPVDPVDPELAESCVLVVTVEFDEEDVEARTAPDPVASCATTTPMTMVAPVAATIAPRVSVRRRD